MFNGSVTIPASEKKERREAIQAFRDSSGRDLTEDEQAAVDASLRAAEDMIEDGCLGGPDGCAHTLEVSGQVNPGNEPGLGQFVNLRLSRA